MLNSCRIGLTKNAIAVLLLLLFLPLSSMLNAREQATISLELEDVDIKEFVRWASQLTDRTIIIHPQVSGRITVIAGQPLQKDEAYHIFLSTLRLHGFAVVESDNALRVIPAAQAKESDLPLMSDNTWINKEDIVVRIVRIVHLSAADIVTLLKPIASTHSYITAYLPTNTLIIADRADKVIQLQSIIEEIDLAGQIDVEIIELTYANADKVSNAIKQLLQPSGGGQNQKFNLNVDDRTNSLLLTGDAIIKDQIRNLIARLDRPVSGIGNAHVVRLQYADATVLVPVLEMLSNTIQVTDKDIRAGNVEIKFRAHEPLNALVITAPPGAMETIRAIIAKLDTRRKQVLVEAIIVEVNEDVARDIGVRWRTNLDTEGGAFGGVSVLPSVISDAISVTDDIPVFGQGLSLGYFRNGSLRALLRALEGESRANILSTPSIVALDNESAEILVGSNVPFVTGSIQRPGDLNPFQTIQRQDIGITLKIKPRVNNANSLTLEIEQKVESIGQTDARTADIITDKRELKTRVLIENNDILVLGGLIRDEVAENKTKVPFLGDIPLLGRAFKSTSNSTVKRNLMIFIHPVILPDLATSNRETQSRYRVMQGHQEIFRERVDRYLLSRELPELPKIETGPTTTAAPEADANQMTREQEEKDTTRRVGPRR